MVGQEYWHSRNNVGWDESLSGGSKVVVVDAGPWMQDRSGWSLKTPAPRRVDKGLGVLVDMTVKTYGSDEERLMRMVVSVTTIKGPYEETKKKIEEFMEANAKRACEAREASDQREAEVQKAVDLAKEYGITVMPRGGHGNTSLIIDLVNFNKLLNAARAVL